MIYRIAGSHLTLGCITLSILLGTCGIMTQQVEFLIENHHLNFIPAEIVLEDDIAILIAAFGVFLEHRGYLLKKVYPDGAPYTIERFDVYAHDFGVMLILIAILIVALDLAFLAFSTWGITFASLKYIEILALFAANVLVTIMMLVFTYRLLSGQRN